MPHTGSILGEHDGLIVIRCDHCGYAHLHEFPTAAELEDLYTNRFWQVDKARALADLESEQDWWQIIYGDWLSVVESQIPERTLLDIGCGYGFFMQAARDQGWIVEGIDSSPKAITYVETHLGFPPLQIHPGSWQAWDSLGKYNALSALWLLEHLPDPLAFLLWARAHLCDKGILLLAVPNDFSRIQHEVDRRVSCPQWYIHPHHLNYFDKPSLTRLLDRAGFHVVNWLATYPMESFLKDGLDYLADGALGARLHENIRAHELRLSRAERLRLYQERAAADEGRDLICIAEANEND